MWEIQKVRKRKRKKKKKRTKSNLVRGFGAQRAAFAVD